MSSTQSRVPMVHIHSFSYSAKNGHKICLRFFARQDTWHKGNSHGLTFIFISQQPHKGNSHINNNIQTNSHKQSSGNKDRSGVKYYK